MRLYPLKLFFKDYFVSSGIFFAILANLFLWIYIPLKARNLGETAFLHYTVHFGVDLIGSWTRFLIIPVISLIVLIVHTGLGYWLYGQTKELARFLIISQVVMYAFLIVSAVALFIIN